MEHKIPGKNPPSPVDGGNPYCPVCRKGGDTGTRPGSGVPVEGHNCLLTIMNSHYALSRKLDREDPGT